nr:MAG TPA: hypothetical protein [Crassvirales sp.]
MEAGFPLAQPLKLIYSRHSDPMRQKCFLSKKL